MGMSMRAQKEFAPEESRKAVVISSWIRAAARLAAA
jgi:hypothetical protein